MGSERVGNAGPATQFNPNDLTPEQRKTWEMQQEISRIQENGTRMNMFMQYQAQQQKERFDSISNAMSKGEKTQDNIIANSK